MMRRYVSIENSYQVKNIAWWLNEHPELENEEFVLQSKIHGANCQLIFYPDSEYKVASRSKILSENEKFYDIFNTLKKEQYQNLIKIFSKYAEERNYIVRLYGETYGSGIQKGVDYGTEKEKEIKFFDIVLDEKFQPPFIMKQIFKSLFKNYDYLVPEFVQVKGLQKAIETDIKFNSLLNPIDNNIEEGVVIKPFYKVYHSQRSIFMLKKKNDKFIEKSKEKKPRRYDSEVVFLGKEFCRYINENRIQSCFSKLGEIERPNQLGEYIKHIIKDAEEDFIKDNEDKLKKIKLEFHKEIFKAGGSTAAIILKKHL